MKYLKNVWTFLTCDLFFLDFETEEHQFTSAQINSSFPVEVYFDQN